MAMKYRSMVVEMVRMFFAVGSPTDCKPLERLFGLMKRHKPSRLLDLTYVTMRRNLHLLIAQVLEVVLKNQTDRLLTYANECYYENLILNVAELVIKLGSVLDDSGRLNELYNTIIDCHSEVFRCLMVAGAGADVFKTTGIVVFSNKSIQRDVFLNAFISIAGYSSQPGRSLSFIRMILNAMSAAQVDILLRSLSARQTFMTEDTPGDLRTSTNDAIEWLRGVEAPPCLKHLARRVITLAFPNGVLRDIATLGLPRNLEQYLLLCH